MDGTDDVDKVVSKNHNNSMSDLKLINLNYTLSDLYQLNHQLYQKVQSGRDYEQIEYLYVVT